MSFITMFFQCNKSKLTKTKLKELQSLKKNIKIKYAFKYILTSYSG